MELHPRLSGDHRGGGGLARAGRAVEDHIRDAPRVAKAAHNAVFAEKMGLTDDIVEGGGSDEFSEWSSFHLIPLNNVFL